MKQHLAAVSPHCTAVHNAEEPEKQQSE